MLPCEFLNVISWIWFWMSFVLPSSETMLNSQLEFFKISYIIRCPSGQGFNCLRAWILWKNTVFTTYISQKKLTFKMPILDTERISLTHHFGGNLIFFHTSFWLYYSHCIAIFLFLFSQVSSHLSDLYTQPNSAEQCLHNALKVVSALKKLGLDYDILVKLIFYAF